MKNFFTLVIAAFLLAVLAVPAFAQVDLRDSVILESKTVDTALTGAPAFFMHVYITNKDSLTYLTLSVRESTISGTAYVVLNTPRSFAGVITPLTPGFQFNFATSFTNYNNASPDRFLVAAGFDPSAIDPPNGDSVNETIEPPNAARKAVWQIKFRHSSAFDSTGRVRFDSIRTSQSTGFVDTRPADIPVNFLPAIMNVCPGGDSLNCNLTDVIEVNSGQRPNRYSLSQNYPNPFNANTQISFALPKAGKTVLEVFNILGQKVNTLVDEYMTAGTKIANWDGRDFSGREVTSGVYFYRLRSEGFLQTKKMLFIK
jgi:hypothetical protein